MTLFGYDTPQFRQCGIFIHNTEDIPVPSIEPKKPNMQGDILQLLRFIKVYFINLIISVSSKTCSKFKKRFMGTFCLSLI